MEVPQAAARGETRVELLERDMELLAQRHARLQADLASKMDRVRSDLEVALLEQVGSLQRRCQRLEGLVAEEFAAKVARRVAAALPLEL
jgi:hypothetical protein